LVAEYGAKKWSVIAEKVPGRIGKQCRERWLNHLDTSVKKTPWTDVEDQLLLDAQKKLGNRWCEIARLLPGRPENAVKNRFNSLNNRGRVSADGRILTKSPSFGEILPERMSGQVSPSASSASDMPSKVSPKGASCNAFQKLVETAKSDGEDEHKENGDVQLSTQSISTASSSPSSTTDVVSTQTPIVTTATSTAKQPSPASVPEVSFFSSRAREVTSPIPLPALPAFALVVGPNVLSQQPMLHAARFHSIDNPPLSHQYASDMANPEYTRARLPPKKAVSIRRFSQAGSVSSDRSLTPSDEIGSGTIATGKRPRVEGART
jgi:hypothetical protein